ncbi:MAG: hypothetical protein JXB42_04260 [Deltaproteobacteria bacterium]|nr:hypothetical protein [Deltaproteobacteria bacterium]
MIKKIIFALMIVVFLAGCGASSGKDSVYLDWGHMGYSWWGYKSPVDDETLKRSQADEWWGKKVVAPGEVEE